MSNRSVGIIGGYGLTGRIVAQALSRSAGIEIVIGGRDLKKAAAALEGDAIPSGKAVAVDAFDAESLKGFCRGRDVVINCTGPTCLVQDRIARTALALGIHYVDPGGYDAVLNSVRDEASRGQSVVVVSAGLFPGIAELLVQHVSGQLDEIERVDLFIEGRSDLSLAVFEDMIHYLFPRPTGYFKGGIWTPCSKWSTSSYRFPDPIGRQSVVPIQWRELERFATQRKPAHLGVNIGTTVPFLLLKGVIPALFKNRTRAGASILKKLYDRDIARYRDTYVLVAEAVGKKDRRPRRITGTIVATGSDHYFLGAIACVLTARMILDQDIAPGVRFLADAVEPASFLERLRDYGLKFELTVDERGP